uniref:Endo/exonuclease/phosphatase domain-containing protein n=1 Tax=Angiostrongylus cantonensis TaxID=6313 RepID=A0A0K0CZV1_ANGCA
MRYDVIGRDSRQHEFVHEHRFIGRTYNPNRRFTIKDMFINTGLTVFVVYAPTSTYDEEEVEAFYMDLEKFYREDHKFFKVIIGDFNAETGGRRKSEKRNIGTHGLEWNEQGERLSERLFIEATKAMVTHNSRSATLNAGHVSLTMESTITK